MARYFYLTPMLGGPGAPRYPVGERAQMVGRSDRAEISLLEPTVSRQHATVQCVDDRIVLRDLGSKHGTFVNSKRVSTARLKIGDIVVFGLSLVMRLEVSDKPVPQPPSGSRVGSGSQELDPPPAGDVAVTAVRTVTIPPRGKTKSGSSQEDFVATESSSKLQPRLAGLQKMVAAGMLSLAHMPEIRGELLELRAALRRQADKGSDLSGPLRSLDGVVARVERLIEALAVLPVTPASTAPLGEVVQAALAARTADLARREVRVLAQIEPGLAVEGEQQRLGAAVGELLRATLPSSREGSLIELAAERSGDEVVLTIADQGAGLPRDVLDRVFDPFMTRSEDWDPLSLDLLEARQALMSHGAMLLIEAKPGRGNTTRIVFRAR